MTSTPENWFNHDKELFEVLGFSWLARQTNDKNKKIAEAGSSMHMFASPQQALEDYLASLSQDPTTFLSNMDFILQVWRCSTAIESTIQGLQLTGQTYGGFYQKHLLREVNLGKMATPQAPTANPQ